MCATCDISIYTIMLSRRCRCAFYRTKDNCCIGNSYKYARFFLLLRGFSSSSGKMGADVGGGGARNFFNSLKRYNYIKKPVLTFLFATHFYECDIRLRSLINRAENDPPHLPDQFQQKESKAAPCSNCC